MTPRICAGPGGPRRRLAARPRASTGFDRVFYPGEIEAENDRKNRQSGITLPDDTVADLTRLARAAGLGDALPF